MLLVTWKPLGDDMIPGSQFGFVKNVLFDLNHHFRFEVDRM